MAQVVPMCHHLKTRVLEWVHFFQKLCQLTWNDVHKSVLGLILLHLPNGPRPCFVEVLAVLLQPFVFRLDLPGADPVVVLAVELQHGDRMHGRPATAAAAAAAAAGNLVRKPET